MVEETVKTQEGNNKIITHDIDSCSSSRHSNPTPGHPTNPDIESAGGLAPEGAFCGTRSKGTRAGAG